MTRTTTYSVWIWLCGAMTVSLAVAAFPVGAYSQINEKQILELIAQNDLDTARKLVDEAWKSHPDAPAANYYRALLLPDAQQALEAYKQIIERFPETSWGRKSAFRVAQFYFARGFYYTARKYFLDVARRDGGPLGQRARYYAAKCLFAAGKRDSARVELQRLQRHTRSQLLQALIDEDMQWYAEERRLPSPVPLTEGPARRYGLQIGAYRQKENAESQKKYFSLLGYPVRIDTLQRKKQKFYRVVLGKFADRRTARKFGEAFKKRYGLNYQILEIGEGHD